VLENRGTRAGRPPDRFADALLEVAAGRCLARLHKRPAALHRLRAGFQILTDLRARPLAEQAEAELAALGMRVRADADRCVPDLTPQELQVARLVGDGMSNREAAGVLYLSPKTIEYHLAHIFAKLGVHTRYQLAARLRSAEPA
jgi:DNA-binding NarL/FixJ family response regulator